MKIVFPFVLLLLLGQSSWAQDRIYRCGNEYTNTVTQEQAKNCKLISGGNVTVVQGTRPVPARAASAQPRADSAEQRSKESDARLILESELKKAQARQAELEKEFANGQPDPLGPELKNHQKYLDRVEAMRADISRNQADIDGIRRELGRLAPAMANN